MAKKKQTYGGRRTELKVDRLRQYCAAFLEAMHEKPYKTVYIEACCGSGTVRLNPPKQTRTSGLIKLPTRKPCIEGLPMQVLGLPQPFTHYYFVDQSQACCDGLTDIVESHYPRRKRRTTVVCDDANVFLQDYCKNKSWTKRRAVIFLDPFGANAMNWTTVEAIAATGAADLLYMLPVGIDVTRKLKLDGQIDADARKCLTKLFGTPDWYDELYTTFETQTLRGPKKVTKRQPGCAAIINYFVRRLEGVFGHVVNWPLRLQNSKHVTLYALCFASPSRQRTRIASELFGTIQLADHRATLPRVSGSGHR
jgi:three-Cys-motif partner protein